jgi:hypothetical protein
MAQTHPAPDLALPPAVRLLGLSGILPQLACIGHAVLFGGSFAGQAGLAYGALILSFLGGLWWIAALMSGLRTPMPYVVAVLPSLLGWGAMLMPAGGLWGIALCLLASPLMDHSLSRRVALPKGWLRLRWQMASGLGLSTLILALLTA